MGPIMTELMPPFLENDFLLPNLASRPQVGMGLIETTINHRRNVGEDKIV